MHAVVHYSVKGSTAEITNRKRRFSTNCSTKPPKWINIKLAKLIITSSLSFDYPKRIQFALVSLRVDEVFGLPWLFFSLSLFLGFAYSSRRVVLKKRVSCDNFYEKQQQSRKSILCTVRGLQSDNLLSSPGNDYYAISTRVLVFIGNLGA